MKSEMYAVIIMSSILILIVLAGLRLVFIMPTFSYNDFCKWEYGENWTFEYSNTFGRTCVELDYITLKGINRTNILLNDKEIENKYCENVSFWDLKRWKLKCGEENKR